MYFFSFRIFNNLRLPWKTEFALKFFTALKYFYLSGFEEPALALKTEFVMKIFAAFDIFLHSGCLSNFCLPWKTECVLNSPYWIYFFSFRIFNNFRLPWKTEFALKMYTAFKWGFWVTCACSENRVFPEIFHCIEYSFTFRIFEQLVLALKNRVCPEFTLLTIYFLSFRILNSLRLPWKTESALEFFTVLKNFLSFEQLVLALKNRLCPEFTLLTIYFLSFRILNNALALKKQNLPWNFFIEMFFIFQDFWETWPCPENRVCPEFFKPGAAARHHASYATGCSGCYIRTTITCKNRHREICGLAHGDDQHFSKIVMTKEINHLTSCGCVR